MVKIITFDATQRALRRDIAHVRGEAVVFETPNLPPEANVQITIGDTPNGPPVVTWDGADRIAPDVTQITALTEGRVYHYNAWLNTNGALHLMARGRYRQIESIEPGDLGSPAPQSTAALPDQTLTMGIAALIPTAQAFSGEGLTFTLAPTSDGLPNGLTLTPTGEVSGIAAASPTTATIVIRATNSGGTAEAAFSLTVVAAATFAVGSSAIGQSNMVGTNALSDVPSDDWGRHPRIRLANPRHLNVPAEDAFLPLTLIPAGQTIDGQSGPISESVGGSGVSALSGAATYVADAVGGDGVYTAASEWIIAKRAQGGQNHAAFLPGGVEFNTFDAIMTDIIAPFVVTTPTRWSEIIYAQGERDATDAVTAAEADSGSTDPATVMPLALSNPIISNWAQSHLTSRRAHRDYLGRADMPYVILGPVLPTLGTGYANSSERAREGIAQQQKNLCRWLVRLDPAGNSITITDMSGQAQAVGWYAVNDAPVFTSIAPTGLRDDTSYYIDARGYASADRLHHDVAAQYQIGRALVLLRQQLYGADAVPPAAHEISTIRPIFTQTPEVTNRANDTLEVALIPSQTGTIHIGVGPSGADTPSEAGLIAGTGAITKLSVAGSKRGALTIALTQVPDAQTVDLYALIETASGRSVIAIERDIAAVSAPAPSYAHSDLPGKAAWITARGMAAGDVSDPSALIDSFGVSALTPLNVDGGAAVAQVVSDIGGQPTLLVKGHASNNGAGGRQRIDIAHGDLGGSFTMAILARRPNPATGQFIAVGATDANGGVRSAFYFANKTGVGGYGSGAQWDISSTQQIPANDTGVHLMVITSDVSASGAKTRIWIDGVEDTNIAAPSATPSWTSATRIGVGASGSVSNYDLYFTDFIILNQALHDNDLRQKMEGRMAWDAGRVDVLPANHPYALAAP